MKLGFIGLGVMGFPMAGHLQKAGHAVTVFNRTQEKARRWQAEYGGKVADTPRAAAEGCDLVFTCVGRDEDVEQVILGDDGALQAMGAGSVLVDHTTTSAVLAKKLAELAGQQQVGFLDAPVSGGQAGAEQGVLSVMVGGEQDVFEKARPVIEAFGKTITLIGGSGSGQYCKMVNQLCITGLLQSLSEALLFGKNVGLDMENVLSVIGAGAAQSWQMHNRADTMLKGEYDFGFAVDWMRKDLGIVLNEAKERVLDLPVATLVDGYYADVQAMEGGRWDTSSLMARLESLHEKK